MVRTREEALDAAVRARTGLERIYGKRLKGVYLFGSAARGQMDEDSDVDVAVVLDEISDRFEEHERTSEFGSEISIECGTLVTFFFMPESDFLEGRYAAYRAVRQEGILV